MGYVALWHNPELRLAVTQGPFTITFRTLGTEGMRPGLQGFTGMYGLLWFCAICGCHPQTLSMYNNGTYFVSLGRSTTMTMIFATAVQQRANIIVIVANNRMYGAIRMHQERAYPGRVSGTGLVNPDFQNLPKRMADTAKP